jgi:hypothetical protein
MHTVTINEGPAMADDNAVYFCNEAPSFTLVAFEGEDCELKFARFVVFTPTNGRAKGKEHRVPLERVVSLVVE